MYQAFHYEHVLIANVEWMAEKDLLNGWAAGSLHVSRLYESAHDGWLQGANQIGHEKEAVFQNAEDVNGLAAVVIRYLATHFFDSFLDLFGGEELTNLC
jgi:hypothetical protein